MSYNTRRKRLLFSRKRYWYHVSTTLKKSKEHLIPWNNSNGDNRSGNEPDGNRICVAPTIEQCITALPYTLTMECIIYRTQDKTKASPARKVFDMNVTDEGWIQTPTTFIKIGALDFERVEKRLKVENVIPESASHGSPSFSGIVLRWWKKARIERFIKRS